MVGMESMVTRARLRYTRGYLTPGICSLIKAAAMKKMNALSRRNPHSHIVIIVDMALINWTTVAGLFNDVDVTSLMYTKMKSTLTKT